MKKIEMIIERTNKGFSAYAQKLPVVTTGKNLTELKSNMVEALNLYFEEDGSSVSENDIIAPFFKLK